jgi:hypothetical protein
MIRCVRMWTGEDGVSLFEEGVDTAVGIAVGVAASSIARRATSALIRQINRRG